MQNNKDVTSVVALGGLGEVGKNMYVVRHQDEIIVIDAGVMFPEDDLMGVDYVIQDFSYLKENQDKIKALIITHGHEDHIGGISFLLQNVSIPIIYAPRIATSLIRNKLEDNHLNYQNLQAYDKDTHLKFKYFEIEQREVFRFTVPFSREGWHGRILSCRGVSAALSEDRLEDFSREHVKMLHKIAPEQFNVKHYAAITTLKKL